MYKYKCMFGLFRLGRGLLGQKDGLNVGKHSTSGDCDMLQQSVELLIILHCQTKMTRDDPGLLVVPGGVPSKLQDLRGEVLHDGGKVDGAAHSAGMAIISLLDVAANASRRENDSGLGCSSLGSLLDFSSLTTAGHVEMRQGLLTREAQLEWILVDDVAVALAVANRLRL